MKPWMRWAAIAAGLAAVVVLFVVLRPGEDDEASPSPTPTASESPSESPRPTESPTESPSETETPSPSPDAVEIEIEVEEGEVQGPGEVEVQQGERVRLVVEADVSDEVHVHGYNLFADVSPGNPAVIPFRANAPGVFEVELEGAGLPLLELTVTP